MVKPVADGWCTAEQIPALPTSASSPYWVQTLHRFHILVMRAKTCYTFCITRSAHHHWNLLTLHFLMKYFKGRQILTEQNPFLNTAGFLFIAVHSLWGTDKFLMENSSIFKPYFILVQWILQLFIVEDMKYNTETFLCLKLFGIHRNYPNIYGFGFLYWIWV